MLSESLSLVYKEKGGGQSPLPNDARLRQEVRWSSLVNRLKGLKLRGFKLRGLMLKGLNVLKGLSAEGIKS